MHNGYRELLASVTLTALFFTAGVMTISAIDATWDTQQAELYAAVKQTASNQAIPQHHQNPTELSKIALIGASSTQTIAKLTTGLHLLNLVIASLSGYWFYTILVGPKRLREKIKQKTQKLEELNTSLMDQQHKLQVFNQAIEQSSNAILITDARGVIEYVNPAFTEITGYTFSEVQGKTPAVLKSSFSTRSETTHLWKTILAGHSWHGERRNRRKNGDYYWSLMSISPIKDRTGKTTHFVSVSEDITDNKEAQLRIEKLAFEDPLTGLANRRFLMDQIALTLQSLSRYRRIAAVLFLDLDKFKEINDNLGHEAGDKLLRSVAIKIKGCIRQTDVAARMGGDEFILLLREINHPEDATQVADKVIERLAYPIDLAGRHITVSTSIGISLIQPDHPSPSQILRQADIALYRAKQTNRGGYCIYTEQRQLSNGVIDAENRFRGYSSR